MIKIIIVSFIETISSPFIMLVFSALAAVQHYTSTGQTLLAWALGIVTISYICLKLFKGFYDVEEINKADFGGRK